MNLQTSWHVYSWQASQSSSQSSPCSQHETFAKHVQEACNRRQSGIKGNPLWITRFCSLLFHFLLKTYWIGIPWNIQDYYDDIRQQQLKELGIIIPDKRPGTSSGEKLSEKNVGDGSVSSLGSSSSCSLSDDEEHFFASTLDPHSSSSSPPSQSMPLSHVNATNQSNHYNHHHQGATSFTRHSSQSTSCQTKSSNISPAPLTSTSSSSLKMMSCSRHGSHVRSRHRHHHANKPYDLTHKHQNNNHTLHRCSSFSSSTNSFVSSPPPAASHSVQYTGKETCTPTCLSSQHDFHQTSSQSCSCKCQMDINDHHRPQMLLPFPSPSSTSLPVRDAVYPESPKNKETSNASETPAPPSSTSGDSMTNISLGDASSRVVCMKETTNQLTSIEKSNKASPYTDLPSGSTTNSSLGNLSNIASVVSSSLPIDTNSPSVSQSLLNSESRVTTYESSNTLSLNCITRDSQVEVTKLPRVTAVTTQRESLESWGRRSLVLSSLLSSKRSSSKITTTGNQTHDTVRELW